MKSSRTVYLWATDGTLYTGEYNGRYLDIYESKKGRPKEMISSHRLSDLDVTDPSGEAVLTRHLPLWLMPLLMHHDHEQVRSSAKHKLSGM